MDGSWNANSGMCPEFLFYAIDENGRDVIELHQ